MSELITYPEKTNITISDVPDVDTALAQWNAYQKLCGKDGILNDSDFQKILVKEKDENGDYVTVEREFKKKSAWQKLARAFNVNTSIVDKELTRTKTGRLNEAYYCVRASLPNGRSVESDALCNRFEKGKQKLSDHAIMSTAKTRATNRAIAELIGAGETSSDEMTADYKEVSPDLETTVPTEQEHETIPVKGEIKQVPWCIKKAYDRLKHKGAIITRESIRAHVNWKSISDEDKKLAEQYIEECCPENEQEELE